MGRTRTAAEALAKDASGVEHTGGARRGSVGALLRARCKLQELPGGFEAGELERLLQEVRDGRGTDAAVRS